MNTNEALERGLRATLADTAPRREPDGLFEGVLALTATVRQRPRLLAGRSTVASPSVSRRSEWPWPLVVMVGLVVLGLLVALGIGAGSRPAEPVGPSAPSLPSSSVISEFSAQLAGTWVADQPASMGFGMPSGPKQMRLILDRNSLFQGDGLKIGWMSADATATAGSVRFVSRIDDFPHGRNLPADGVSVPDPRSSNGSTLVPACRAGDRGVYVWSAGPERDGTLQLTATSDECPSRRAIFDGRLWERSVSSSISGQVTVDAFVPSFRVTLPAKDYDITRTNASYEAMSPDRNVRFAAWQDPRVFNNGCDARAGRIETGPGVEALIAALEARPELTVQLQPGRRVGGRIAEVVRVGSRANDGCPRDLLQAWQPAAETSGRAWTIYPGSGADLVLVDVGPNTVMFAVNVASPPEEPSDQVLDSISFMP